MKVKNMGFRKYQRLICLQARLTEQLRKEQAIFNVLSPTDESNIAFYQQKIDRLNVQLGNVTVGLTNIQNRPWHSKKSRALRGKRSHE